MKDKFKAMLVRETETGKYIREIVQKDVCSLPDGEVLIEVKYSSLNYKDALSASGNKGVTRKYPHTPGIDAAGIVRQSISEAFKAGDEVIVTGYDLGMNTSGGYGEYIKVPASWVVKLPSGMSLRESMIYGTAGITAAISVYKLLGAGIKPEAGEVLVTGATGGVGSIAAAILSKLGYSVIAATGKQEAKDMLVKIGVKDIILREELEDKSGRPMLKERWAGVIDTVGGSILSSVIKAVKYNGAVTTCGNVGGQEFNSSVYPFILRGITLLGVDSVQCPMELRLKLWELLSKEWRINSLEENTEEVSLEKLEAKIEQILQGKIRGRVLVNIDI